MCVTLSACINISELSVPVVTCVLTVSMNLNCERTRTCVLTSNKGVGMDIHSRYTCYKVHRPLTHMCVKC